MLSSGLFTTVRCSQRLKLSAHGRGHWFEPSIAYVLEHKPHLGEQVLVGRKPSAGRIGARNHLRPVRHLPQHPRAGSRSRVILNSPAALPVDEHPCSADRTRRKARRTPRRYNPWICPSTRRRPLHPDHSLLFTTFPPWGSNPAPLPFVARDFFNGRGPRTHYDPRRNFRLEARRYRRPAELVQAPARKSLGERGSKPIFRHRTRGVEAPRPLPVRVRLMRFEVKRFCESSSSSAY